MAKRTYSDEERKRALDLYRESGPTAAETELGIPKATVASWARRAGVHTRALENASARVRAQSLRWEERRLELANGIGELAAVARRRALEEARHGSPRDAQALATTMAIAVDKAQLLTGAVTSRTERIDGSIDAQVAELERELALSGPA